jgi:hypothetical protein
MAVTAATQSALVAFRSFPPGVFSSLGSERCLIPKEKISLVAVLALVIGLGTSITGRFRLITLATVSNR